MSSGIFTTATYGASYSGGASHPIRVQPETLAAAVDGLANAGLVGSPASPISAQISKSPRSLGLHARIIFLKILGAPPTGYFAFSRTSIPILDPANFATFSPKGTTVNYLGTTWEVTGARAEVTR